MEICSRFVFDRKHYSPRNMELKAKALVPNKALQTSVFLVLGLSEQEIWDIGKGFVASRRNKRVLARGDLSGDAIESQGLQIAPDPKDHPKHANIVGWPIEKDEIKRVTQDLAAEATLVLASD